MNKNTKYILVLVILAYFFFFFGNSIVSLTSPDEVFYTQTAKEMARHHSWMTPILFDQPQFEKPIFLYWLLRIAFLIFGINSFSARFFPAFFALAGIISVYFFTKLLFKEEKKAFVSALVLLSSMLYIGLARTVFTDMVFSVMILFSLLSFYWGYVNERRKGAGIILFFVFSALAVLTKGPLGLVITFMVVIVFLLLMRKIKFIFCRYTLLGVGIFLAIALPWYIFMTAKYNQSFIHEFFYNDHYRRLIRAEHHRNDTWYFYPLTMLGCLFPWSIFVAVAFFYLLRHIRKINTGNVFLTCWVVVVFLVFQFARSKLTSYIFPAFPALAMICGNFIYDSITDKTRQRQFFVLSGIMCFMFLVILFGSIIVVSLKFSHYLASLRPVYLLASVFVLWLSITMHYLLKKKSFVVFCLFALFVPIIMAAVPFIHQDIEPYLSSEYACSYLLKNYPLSKEAYLLCSKDFVRGTRFYTDMKVAVFALNEGNFFSPHPIPFLDSDEKAREFLLKQPLTYGFLKKSSLVHLQRIANNEFEYQVLKDIGNQCIVRIQPR